MVADLGPDHWAPRARTGSSSKSPPTPARHSPPLVKIASGGELSRFILALKVALAEQGSAATMIFDEIDRGVGGAVASAIGERLARLAATPSFSWSRTARRSPHAARITC